MKTGWLFWWLAVAIAPASFSAGGESLGWKEKRQQRRVEKELDDHIQKVWEEVVRDRARKHKAAEELAKGWNKFLSKGHSRIYVGAGVIIIVWLCHRGALGCGDEDDHK